MTTIYIIRHGETEANTRHACVGHKDVPLNDNGRSQAELLAQRLKDVNFDIIYSSPLKRVIQTVNFGIAPAMSTPIVMNFALIERDYGEWDDLSFEEIKSKYPQELKEWKENWISFNVPSGESAQDVQKRVNAFLKKIITTHKDQKIALATHLGTARHIISYLLGLTTEQSWLFTLDNAKYAVIEVDDNGHSVLKGLNL